MMTMTKKTALLAGLLALAAPVQARIGLSTQFIDVEFEGLKPGGVYNLRELRGVPYTVKNRGSDPVQVQVEAQTPKAVEAPYEALPDPSWVELNPGTMRVDPESLGFSDIIIRIPDDPALNGRHFQATIWAHTVGTGMLAAGVNSRLRFSIGPGPDTVARRELADAVVSLNYDLWPNALYLTKAKTGALYDGKAAEGRQFMLTNRTEAELELVPKAVRWPVNSLPLPAGGWEAPEDLSWVRFEPSTAAVAGLSVEPVRVVLYNAPEALKGKKAAFLIQLRLPNGMVVNQTHRGFVTFAADETISTPVAPAAPKASEKK
jgi:hypothetical protein